MDAWQRHEQAEEEKAECLPVGSMAAGAEVEYNRTIDQLQNVFALEIAKREDELSTLKALRAMGNKVVQDAASEIARLEAALKAQRLAARMPGTVLGAKRRWLRVDENMVDDARKRLQELQTKAKKALGVHKSP